MQRNNSMQLLAGLCLMSGAFPLWYWYCTWAVPQRGYAFVFTGGSLMLTALCFLHRRYGFVLESKSLLLAGVLARLLAVLLGVGSYFLVVQYLAQTAAIVAGVMVFLVYLTDWAIFRLPTDKLLSVHAFILICVAFFMGLLLSMLQKVEFGDICYVVFGVNMCLFGILRNRLMVTETLAGRNMPQGFWRHDLGMMALFLLPGAALFAVHKPVAEAAGYVLHLIWTFLKNFFRMLSALVYRKDTLSPDDAMMPEMKYRQDLTWLEMLITMAAVGLLIFLIIRFRSELWDLLRQVASELLRSFRKLIHAKALPQEQESHPDYTDSVELLDTAAVHVHHQKRMTWRKYYKAYRQAKDPVQKFRCGYAFWMHALRHWHTDVPPNAVPAKLVELSSGIPDPELTAQVTELYYRVRYGGIPPTEQELAMMQQLVREVRKMLITVHHKQISY